MPAQPAGDGSASMVDEAFGFVRIEDMDAVRALG
jgi:hypothetical protein